MGTGEKLSLEVYSIGDSFELTALESGQQTRLSLDKETVQGLDPEDKWTDLFSRVGVDPGPPRSVVLSSLVGRREVSLAPDGSSVELAISRYTPARYFFSAVDFTAVRTVELAVKEDVIAPELVEKLEALADDTARFDELAGRLSLQGGILSF